MTNESEALDLIASVSGGSPRTLLRTLETVSAFGPVTEQSTRLALKLDFVDRLVSFANAILDRNLDAALKLIDDWTEMPGCKLEVLHHLFVHCYLTEILRIERDDPQLKAFPGDMRARIAAAFAERSACLGLDAEQFWQDALELLAPRDGITEHRLLMAITNFERHIGKPNRPALDPAPIRAVQKAPRASFRARTDGPASEDGCVFPWSYVRQFWEIGSYLPQCFGVLFNVRITLAFKPSTPAGHRAGTKLVSELTRQLSARIAYRSPSSQAHWLYGYETTHDGTLVTRILMAIPERELGYALDWLQKFNASRAETGLAHMQVASRTSSSVGVRVKFHWKGIRALSRCLDPGACARDARGERVPLLDLLRIPKGWQGRSGNRHAAQGQGASQLLTPTARKKLAREQLPVLSAVNDRAWDYIDTGWELDEYAARQREQARRDDARASVQAKFVGSHQLSHARLAEELAAMERAFATDPKEMRRRWYGWWQQVAKWA